MSNWWLFKRKFTEAWIACAVAMVQGDLAVFSWGHVGVAAQTGLATGVAMVIANSLGFVKTPWMAIWLTGVLTTASDIIIHQPAFPYEAIVTGIGAGILAYIFSKVLK
jgi:hypothetical protein